MKTLRLLLLAAFFIFSLMACHQDDDVPGCQAVAPSPDCVCYQVYAPVCGCDGVTYANDCVAECHGILDYEAGECLN